MKSIFAVIVFILILSLFRHFDFDTLQFKMPRLDTLYAIALICAIFFLVKETRKTGQPNK
ncbi:MAG: hypothetical protein EOO88_14870 [Pedobacter sp.]|nr:MAG: hypothetical protein EOO88_14870 [Pedobacter sp.]